MREIFIILAAAVVVSGFTYVVLQAVNFDGKRQTVDKQAELQKAAQCEEWGGIPILNTWDNRLEDCIFKPNAKTP